MASQQPADASQIRGAGQKRASRKGAVRRFACNHPGCDKKYSRTEHLQRHQLNHNPKEIFQCDVGDCSQRFVRLDLLVRHKKRHTPSYAPRNRVPSFDTPLDWSTSSSKKPPLGQPHEPLTEPLPLKTTPDSPAFAAPRPPPMPRQALYACDAAAMQEPAPMLSLSAAPYLADNQLTQGNSFAAWILDPQATYSDLASPAMPFAHVPMASVFGNAAALHPLSLDHESLDSISSTELASVHSDSSPDWLDEARHHEVLYWFHELRRKQSAMANVPLDDGATHLPVLSLEMMQRCLDEFWSKLSPRLPMIHQPSFRANACPILLLLVMMALGAASSSYSKNAPAPSSHLAMFADVVVTGIRWEILTCHDSTPPVALWVAQALLLVEFFEKLYSSRRLHERAHIYHPSFLTLLRRGSPLIGSPAGETPTEPQQNRSRESQAEVAETDLEAWWARWIAAESMRRVVFVAFMLDIMHAAMFGHASEMAAHEIRLPLPCEDYVWRANNACHVRQLEAAHRWRRLSFLDGLKNAFHSKEVKTHAFGRIIIMCGLLSVGWHLGHRETHLKWLDLWAPPNETQTNWRKMLLRALDGCKESLDSATTAFGYAAMAKEPVPSAAIVYHLAHISLYVDIVDCQVYAGAHELMGRRMSSQERGAVAKRMSIWSRQPSTRHAILHAFRLLHCILVRQCPPRHMCTAQTHYSIACEGDAQRPWIMYYAVLAIWAFVQAIGRPPGKGFPLQTLQAGDSAYASMSNYVAETAGLHELDEGVAAALHEGLPDLLDVVEGVLEEARAEVLVEARGRLGVCKEMLLGGGGL
ncbi:hypothetical protein CDD81_1739 [Ophiocordyceps australis]|uniref:C2H2-type domain-containing protein n=1 Tax=Ophiocordyceps australis TaxID=1399860 RepID=A0A2C5YDG5_9HYPO|nr:hypothetical protein CDD81_1739 [Ophiocordyceps australis]